MIESLPGVFEPASFKRFLVIRTTDGTNPCEGHTFRCTGELSRFFKFSAENFTLRGLKFPCLCATAEQCAKMSVLRTLDGTPVNVVSRASLNFVKGVVYFSELLGYSVEELIKELAD